MKKYLLTKRLQKEQVKIENELKNPKYIYLDLANFDYIKHVFPINMEINGRDLTNLITLSS